MSFLVRLQVFCKDLPRWVYCRRPHMRPGLRMLTVRFGDVPAELHVNERQNPVVGGVVHIRYPHPDGALQPQAACQNVPLRVSPQIDPERCSNSVLVSLLMCCDLKNFGDLSMHAGA